MVDASTTIAAVSVDEAKAHMRVEHDIEDDVIASLVLSATQAAEARMHRPIIARETEQNAICESIDLVPNSIKIWICMFVNFLYENRSIAAGTEMKTLQFANSLLDPWILYE